MDAADRTGQLDIEEIHGVRGDHPGVDERRDAGRCPSRFLGDEKAQLGVVPDGLLTSPRSSVAPATVRA